MIKDLEELKGALSEKELQLKDAKAELALMHKNFLSEAETIRPENGDLELQLVDKAEEVSTLQL